MRIRTVQHAIPSLRVTNDDMLAMIREANRSKFSADDLAHIERKVQQFWRIAGTEVRYFTDVGEKSIDLVLEAGRSALKDATVDPEDVDFVIYTGVGRGWLEPAMANVVQSELGLKSASAFDVMDACASWLKALQIASAFIKSGTHKTGMIVNCESSFKDWATWELSSVDDLEHLFAAYTVGEAATATIVTDEDPENDFYFNFKTYGDQFGLCMIPLPNMADFMPDQPDARLAPGKFFSLSTELISTTVRLIIDTFKADERLSGAEFDMIFGHQASDKVAPLIARRCGLPLDRYYSTHSRFGNTVSASVPLGISLAVQEDRLHRGDRTLIIMGSAGISLGFATFTY